MLILPLRPDVKLLSDETPHDTGRLGFQADDDFSPLPGYGVEVSDKTAKHTAIPVEEGDTVLSQVSKPAGVVFIATGEKYSAAAVAAAVSVRETNPWLGITLFTDHPQDSTAFDHQIEISDGHYRSKVDHLAATPYEHTLYLDTDTRVVADLKPMFGLLERFDMALAHAHRRNRKATLETWRIDIPEAFPQLNCGVMLYRRSPQTIEVLNAWSQHFRSAGFEKDQVTFRELIWTSDLRLYILPPEYNIRFQRMIDSWIPSEAVPKILHMRKYHDGIKPDPLLTRIGKMMPWSKSGG